MSLPSLTAKPSRLSGFAILLSLVALSVSSLGMGPAGQSAAGAASASATSWRWPVGPTRVIVRPFVAPPTPYSAGHRGIDIGATAGASVVAPADGVVHFVGVVVDRPVVSIRHPGGLISSFEPVDSHLTEGETIALGEVIGTVVAGHCSSPCLHFGVRLHGEYVSPLNYLGGIPPSILLPTRRLS